MGGGAVSDSLQSWNEEMPSSEGLFPRKQFDSTEGCGKGSNLGAPSSSAVTSTVVQAGPSL